MNVLKTHVASIIQESSLWSWTWSYSVCFWRQEGIWDNLDTGVKSAEEFASVWLIFVPFLNTNVESGLPGQAVDAYGNYIFFFLAHTFIDHKLTKIFYSKAALEACSGSIMQWECFSEAGTEWLAQVECKMTAGNYINNIQEKAKSEVNLLYLIVSYDLTILR